MGTDMYAKVYNKKTKKEIQTIIPEFFDGRNYTKYTLIAGIRENVENYTPLISDDFESEDWYDEEYAVSVKELKTFNWMQLVTYRKWVTKAEVEWCETWNETPRSWCAYSSREEDYVKDYEWEDYAMSFDWVQKLHYWLDTLTSWNESDDNIIIAMSFD